MRNYGIDIWGNKQLIGTVNVHGDWDQYIQQKTILMEE